MSIKRKYLVFLVGFCFILAYGQQEESQKTGLPDSLLQKSYEELKSNFYKYKKDFPRAYAYAKGYLKKGIFDKDTIRQANAWYLLSLIHKPAIAEKYADSIISLTKTIDDNTYSAKGFLVKGLALYRMGEYKEALDQLLKAYTYARDSNNMAQLLEVTYQISSLKIDLGESEEALAIFRSYLQEATKKYEDDQRNANNYIRGLYALGDAYNRNKKYDSAAIINKKGFEVSLKNKDSISAKYFVLSMGVTEYLKGNYNVALDSLRKTKKALITRNDTANLTVCYLYMGRIYRNQGKTEDALLYFKKVDSIVKKTSNAFPEIIDAYEFLIDHYIEKNDDDNHSKYMKRLLAIYSLLDDNKQYLSKTIHKKYTAPELRRAQEIIIARQRRNKIIWIASLLLGLTFISAFTYYYYRKQRLYHTRLRILLSEMESELSYVSEETLHRISEQLTLFEQNHEFLNNDLSLTGLARRWETNSRYLADIIQIEKRQNFRDYIGSLRKNYTNKNLKPDTTTIKNPDLSYIAPETLKRILEKLALFEQEHEFLNSDVSLNYLAKKWKTNSSYITAIIKVRKGKKLRDYISDLRIDYTIKKLKTDTNFRKYTIEAIAEEVGFKTTGTFSRAFLKRAGVYPSSFIRNL